MTVDFKKTSLAYVMENHIINNGGFFAVRYVMGGMSNEKGCIYKEERTGLS